MDDRSSSRLVQEPAAASGEDAANVAALSTAAEDEALLTPTAGSGDAAPAVAGTSPDAVAGSPPATDAQLIEVLRHSAAIFPPADGLAVYDLASGRLRPLGAGDGALLGHSPEDLESLDRHALLELVHVDDLADLERFAARVATLADGEAAAAALRLRDAAGSWRPVQVRAAVVGRDAARQPTLVLASAGAVPEEQGLAAGEREILAGLLENVSENITVSEGPPAYGVIAHSRAAGELFGEVPPRLADLAAGAAQPSVPDAARGGTGTEALPPCRASRQGTTVAGEEWLLRRPDGSAVTVDVTSVPLRRGNTIIGAVSSWREARERRRLEEALRERAEQLALLSHSAQACWWSCPLPRDNERDAEATISWSGECRLLFGWTAEQTISLEQFLAAVHADDRHRVGAAFRHGWLDHAAFSLEFRVVQAGGEERWLAASADCHCDDAGQPLSFFGALIDITARRRTEAALRESEQRFRQLAENIDEVFWVLDPVARKWLYLSPAHTRLFGAEGRDPDSWLAAVDAADRARIARLFAGETAGPGFSEEYRVRTARGTRWMRDRGMVTRDDAGQVMRMLGVTEDITGRKMVESGQRQTLASEAVVALAEELAARRRTLNKEVALMSQLSTEIRQLVGATRHETQRPRQPEEVDAAQVVEQAVVRARPVAVERHQTLALRVATAPMPLAGDLMGLVQATARLIGDAARQAAEGGRIEIHAEPRNGLAVVQVIDSGAGLSQSILDQVLDLQVRSKGGEGEIARLAAGIAEVRLFAEGRGGSLTVESAGPQGGGRLTLRLPLTADNDHSIAEPAVQRKQRP